MHLDEFLTWQAHYEIEPFGDAWKQTSYICSMIGNAAGGKKGKTPFKPSDFMPVRQPHYQRKQSGQEMLAIFRLMAGQQKAVEHNRRINGLGDVKG